jgi:hypothetical protein
MSNKLFPTRHNKARGSAAVEFALILPIIVSLLAFSLFFGRVFWHYSVIQKAAYDAARYLSTVEPNDMKSPERVNYSLEVAKAIIAAETAELNPLGYRPDPLIQCNGDACDAFVLPNRVRVQVRMRIMDTIFSEYTGETAGDDGYAITADVTLPYVAN